MASRKLTEREYEQWAENLICDEPEKWLKLLNNDKDLATTFTRWTSQRCSLRDSPKKPAVDFICEELYKILPGLQSMLQPAKATPAAGGTAGPSIERSKIVYAPYQFGKTLSIIAYCWVRTFRDRHFVVLLLNNREESQRQFLERDVPEFTALLHGIMKQDPMLFQGIGDTLDLKKKTSKGGRTPLRFFYALNNPTWLQKVHHLAALIAADKEKEDLWGMVALSQNNPYLPFTLVLDEAHDNISGEKGVMQGLLEGPLKLQDFTVRARNGQKALAGSADHTANSQSGPSGEAWPGNSSMSQRSLANIVEDLVYLTASPLTPLMGKRTPDGRPAPMPFLVDIEDKPPQTEAWSQLEYCGLTNGRVTFTYWDKKKTRWEGMRVFRTPSCNMQRVASSELPFQDFTSNADAAWKRAVAEDPEAYRACNEFDVLVKDKDGGEPTRKTRRYGFDYFQVDLVTSLMACWSSPALHHGLFVFSNKHNLVQGAQAGLLARVFNHFGRVGVIISYNKQNMHLLLPKAAMPYADELTCLLEWGMSPEEFEILKESESFKLTSRRHVAERLDGPSGAYVQLTLSSDPPVNEILIAIEKLRRRHEETLKKFTPVLISHEMTKQSVTLKANDADPESSIKHVTMFKMCYAAVPPNNALHMEVLQAVGRVAGQYQRSALPALYITGPLEVVQRIAALALCQQAGIEYVTTATAGDSLATYVGLKEYITKQVEEMNETVKLDIMKSVTSERFLLLVSSASVLKYNRGVFDVEYLLSARDGPASWVLDVQLEEWLTNNHPELMKGTDEERSKVVAAIKECVDLYKEGEKVGLVGERYVSLLEAVKRTLFEEMDSNSKSSFDFEEYLLDSIMDKTKKMPSYLKNLDFWTETNELSVRKLGPVLEKRGKQVNLHPHLRIAREFIVDMEINQAGADDEDEVEEDRAQAVIDQDDQDEPEAGKGNGKAKLKGRQTTTMERGFARPLSDEALSSLRTFISDSKPGYTTLDLLVKDFQKHYTASKPSMDAIKAAIKKVAEKRGGVYVLKPDTSSTAKRKFDDSASIGCSGGSRSSKKRSG